MLVVGWPISRYAIRHGVDIDLLTRGASFGYIGSTITSLIYASFTFMLFAIEASIMTAALELAFGLPLWIGYIISAVVVIPLVVYGVRLISRFQLITQPFWIVLNILPFLFIAALDWEKFDLWRAFAGIDHSNAQVGGAAPFNLVEFGAASAVILALMPQIGEQVDFLRFLPASGMARLRHRLAVFLAGPGWVVGGCAEAARGLLPAVLTLSTGVPAPLAADPAHMYLTAFGYMIPQQTAALLLMAAFVVVSQLKINVMNAYAGSLAWSNFFSRSPTATRAGWSGWSSTSPSRCFDGARHLPAAGGDARHLLHHRHVLAGDALGRSRRQQAARPFAAGHRVQACASL